MRSINSNCHSNQFQCADGRCIFERYRCDQFRDCRDGSDEAVELCGDDPCQGRIQCENDGRCIPISWCCHRPASIPDGPYACDFWQSRLCCSRSEIKFDPSGLLQLPETTQAPTSRNSSAMTPGIIVAVCVSAFVALILLAIFFGYRYFKNKRQRQQNHTNDEETVQHGGSRRRQRRRCRSHSAPNRSVAENGTGNLIVDHRRSSADNANEVFVLFMNNGRIRYPHHGLRNPRCRRCDPPCQLLVQFPNSQNVSTTVEDAPPPSYADSVLPPPYSSVVQDSAVNDGLPGYNAALNLMRTDSITH